MATHAKNSRRIDRWNAEIDDLNSKKGKIKPSNNKKKTITIENKKKSLECRRGKYIEQFGMMTKLLIASFSCFDNSSVALNQL